jgi:hypothetical protein
MKDNDFKILLSYFILFLITCSCYTFINMFSWNYCCITGMHRVGYLRYSRSWSSNSSMEFTWNLSSCSFNSWKMASSCFLSVLQEFSQNMNIYYTLIFFDSGKKFSIWMSIKCGTKQYILFCSILCNIFLYVKACEKLPVPSTS